MPKRTCDSCGKQKDVKGGKVCEKGRFMWPFFTPADGLLGWRECE